MKHNESLGWATAAIIITILIYTCRPAQATLIDETPGGFNDVGPPLLYKILRMHQIAGANIDGTEVIWSPFEPFGADHFSITTIGINANVLWDLTSTEGYFLQYVLIEGLGGFFHIYRANTPFTGEGFVTANGTTQIQGIIFYGGNIVPEAGATAVLLALGISCILGYRLWLNH